MASVSAAGGINSAGKSVVTCQWYKCCCCSGRKLLFSPCDRSIRVSLALVLASTRSVSSVCWCSTLLTAASALPSSEWQCHNVYSLPSLHRHSLPNAAEAEMGAVCCLTMFSRFLACARSELIERLRLMAAAWCFSFFFFFFFGWTFLPFGAAVPDAWTLPYWRHSYSPSRRCQKLFLDSTTSFLDVQYSLLGDFSNALSKVNCHWDPCAPALIDCLHLRFEAAVALSGDCQMTASRVVHWLNNWHKKTLAGRMLPLEAGKCHWEPSQPGNRL